MTTHLKAILIPLAFSLSLSFAEELPPEAQAAVNEYTKAKEVVVRKLNQDLFFRLRSIKGTLERFGDAEAVAAVQNKIEELEAEVDALAEANANAQKATDATSVERFSVVVYEEEDFKGNQVRLRVPFEITGPQERKKAGIKNDSINSLKVPRGVEIILYDGELGGRFMRVTEDTSSLGGMRNTISSLTARVVRGN